MPSATRPTVPSKNFFILLSPPVGDPLHFRAGLEKRERRIEFEILIESQEIHVPEMPQCALNDCAHSIDRKIFG